MFEVFLLGNGGMMPMPNRLLTALYTRYNGYNILIDCGEGTQLALKEYGLSCKDMDLMLITHYHGDHTIGIPGMLLLAGNQGKTTPLTIVGPKGLNDVIKGLRVIAPELPFEVNCIEIDGDEMEFKFNDLIIKCFKVDHSLICYGYSINLPRTRKFNPDRAKELGIDVKYWGKLQKGESVELDNIIYTPDMVLGKERVGLKIVYTTDTRPTNSIIKNSYNADLFICEGMYGDETKKDMAIEKKHMTFSEAAEMAREANVKELWLTHYSPSLKDPDEYIDETRKIFSNTKAFKHGGYIDLRFEE